MLYITLAIRKAITKFVAIVKLYRWVKPFHKKSNELHNDFIIEVLHKVELKDCPFSKATENDFSDVLSHLQQTTS